MFLLAFPDIQLEVVTFYPLLPNLNICLLDLCWYYVMMWLMFMYNVYLSKRKMFMYHVYVLYGSHISISEIWSLGTKNFINWILFFRVSRWYCLFFVLYMLLGVYFMTNLILAVIYDSFKNQVQIHYTQYAALVGVVVKQMLPFYICYSFSLQLQSMSHY